MSTTDHRPREPVGSVRGSGGRDGAGVGRTAVIVVCAAAVLGALGGVGVALRRAPAPATASAGTAGAGVSPTTSSAPATNPPTAPPTSSAPAVTLANVGQVDAAAAEATLAAAGLSVTGTPQAAWQWTDAGGRNLLLLTRQITHTRPNGIVDAATLRVVQAAGIGVRPVLLRTLIDPGLVTGRDHRTCPLEFQLDFVNGSVTVTETDGTGYAEVTVGWWSACRGDPGPGLIKLALLQNGRYFILRGRGLPAQASASVHPAIPPATFRPDPSPSQWPANSYPPTVALFHRLYA